MAAMLEGALAAEEPRCLPALLLAAALVAETVGLAVKSRRWRLQREEGTGFRALTPGIGVALAATHAVLAIFSGVHGPGCPGRTGQRRCGNYSTPHREEIEATGRRVPPYPWPVTVRCGQGRR